MAQGKGRVDLETLATIAVETEHRGPHAFGFAWLDGRGRLKMFKRAGRISNNLHALDRLEGARVVIGHCRYATHGSPGSPYNNHPHPAGRGWYVHNGVIGDYLAVARRFDLTLSTECDSEVIGRLLERRGGPLLARTAVAMSRLRRSPLTMLGLWPGPTRVVAVRRAGQPLYAGGAAEGSYLASRRAGLPGQVVELPDDTAWEWAMKGGTSRVRV